MTAFAVIIPSKLSSNLFPCLEALYAAENGADVIVVDDGLDERPDGPRYLQGVKPFIFARNVNLGIEAADGKDIVLMNDDVLVKTPQGLTLLGEFAHAHREIGVVAPATNVTGNAWQWPQNACPEGWREVGTIPYVCVYLRREVLDSVGLLDERYCLDYGVEDLDHTERMKDIGLGCAVTYNVFVDHGSLRSTFRGAPNAPGDYSRNKRLFDEKRAQMAQGKTS